MRVQTVAEFQTPHGRSVRFSVRDGTNDWNTLTATLTNDEYELPAGLSGVALDIGGYLGSVGIALAKDNPDLRVWIVEPVPGNCDLIGESIEINKVGDRVTLIPGAVGREGVVSIGYDYWGTESAEHHRYVGNSTLAAEDERVNQGSTATYQALTLGRLLQLTRASEIAFLKIDTEGAEWDFLDDPLVSRVETIVGEWHPVDGHTIGDLTSLLGSTHVVTFSGPQAGPGGFWAVRRTDIAYRRAPHSYGAEVPS